MKDMGRKKLELKYMREDMRRAMNDVLFRNTMDRFDDDEIRSILLAVCYLNGVVETAIAKQGITENDLSDNHREHYRGMKVASSLADMLDDLSAQLPDEDDSTGSE